LLFIGQPDKGFTSDVFTDKDYAHIMKDNITGDPLVTDIAMLAAHDALSYGITKDSPFDSDGIKGAEAIVGFLNDKGIINAVGGGVISRLSAAQKSSAYELLKRGARYFDLRVAEYKGEWYICHGPAISVKLSVCLEDFMRFLDETDGELVVLELRHVYFKELTHTDLNGYMESFIYNGKKLVDFIRFDAKATPLEDLRYSDAVNGGSGIVVLTPESSYPTQKNDGTVVIKDDTADWAYGILPRAVWHNQVDDEKILEGIRTEYEYLKNNMNEFKGNFRINQAQKTPTFAFGSIAQSLLSWSLIDMADKFNASLSEQPDIKDWLSVMPVFQVDYADSMKDGFNDKIMGIINEYNGQL
jgi:hypothetical protein